MSGSTWRRNTLPTPTISQLKKPVRITRMPTFRLPGRSAYDSGRTMASMKAMARTLSAFSDAQRKPSIDPQSWMTRVMFSPMPSASMKPSR